MYGFILLFLLVTVLIGAVVAGIYFYKHMHGDIHIKLKNRTTNPQELVTGDITLKFKNELQSDHIDIMLVAEEQRQTKKDGKRHIESKEVYRSAVRVENAQNYHKGQSITYHFEIQVPNINQEQASHNHANPIRASIHKFKQRLSKPELSLVWKIEGRLNAPEKEMTAIKTIHTPLIFVPITQTNSLQDVHVA